MALRKPVKAKCSSSLATAPVPAHLIAKFPAAASAPVPAHLIAKFAAAASAVVAEHDSPNGRGWIRLLELLRDAARDPIVVASPGAMGFLEVITLLAEDSLSDSTRFLKGVMFYGKGRGEGRVTVEVRRVLKRRLTANAAAVWDVLKAKPPKGMAFCENNLGKYIETEGERDTGYRRFANIVTKVRSEVRNPK